MKGKVLEEIVQRFLVSQGYEKLDERDPKINLSNNYVQGRGTSHQIDALGKYEKSVPFVFPIRLLGEAKCYDNKAVGVDVVREAIAVRKDISENYIGHSDNIPSYRHLDCVAIFSTSGYSSQAKMLAIAHNIFLVHMGHVRVHVDRIIKEYDPTDHTDARGAVGHYFTEVVKTRPFFGNYARGYPVMVLAESFPIQAIAESDHFNADASRVEESPPGAIRYSLSNEYHDWSGVVELPDASLPAEKDQQKLIDNIRRVSIMIPTMIDEVYRKIRLELTLENRHVSESR